MTKKADRLHILPSSLPPFGVDRVQAAALVGVGESLFDKCVAAGTLPQPRVIGGRNIWDTEELYQAFKRIPHRSVDQSGASALDPSSGTVNPWDDA